MSTTYGTRPEQRGCSIICAVLTAVSILAIMIIGSHMVYGIYLSPYYRNVVLREQARVKAYNNWNAVACQDPVIRASANGYDDCNDHLATLGRDVYAEAARDTLEELKWCDRGGCFIMSFTPLAFFTQLLPMCGLVAIVGALSLIFCLFGMFQRGTMHEKELPYSNAAVAVQMMHAFMAHKQTKTE